MFNSDRYFTPSDSTIQSSGDYDDTVFHTKPCPFGACENPRTNVCSSCSTAMCKKHTVGTICARCHRQASEEN